MAKPEHGKRADEDVEIKFYPTIEHGMRRLLLCASLLLIASLLLSCEPVHRAGGFDVVSLSKVVDRDRPDHAICDSLVMTRADVVTYFSLADEVDATEFHDEAMIMPCRYQGSIRMSGHLYRWEIFAGGAGYLYDGSALNKRYLCRGKCLAALPELQ